MKVWRKRIIRFSFRDNPSSPVFAHTLLAMSLLGGYLVLGLGTAGVLAYVGLRTDSTRGPWHPFAGSVLWYCLRRHFGFHVPGVAPLRGPGIQACAARPTAPV